MRSKFRTTFATAAAAAMVLGTAGLAAADDVESTSDYFGTDTKMIVMEVGDTASVTLGYIATGTGQNPADGKQGCNLSGGPGTQLVLDVVGTAAPAPETGAGLTGLPATVTFEDCTVDGAPATVQLSFAATSPGTTYFTFPVNTEETVAQGTFDTSGANFMVTVLAPEADEGRDAPAIANEYLKGLSSTQLTACKENNGTNKNQANWHGQLISKVAHQFEGQSFGPSREHIVTSFVNGECKFA
jgi:hypothetical protein